MTEPSGMPSNNNNETMIDLASCRSLMIKVKKKSGACVHLELFFGGTRSPPHLPPSV